MGILNHHNAGVDHRADRDGDTTERHDVDVEALHVDRDERHQHAYRQSHDRDQPAAEMRQEKNAYQRHDQELLRQRRLEAVDRALDQPRAVVGDLDLDPFGQAGLDVLQLGLDVVDDLQGVCTVADDHDAADRLAFAVPVGQAAPHLGAQADARYVTQEDRRTAFVDT